MQVAIVVPCLNEEATLANTCASLGFGSGARSTSADTVIVLVDNGSTDQTRAVMAAVRDHSAPGSVILSSEAERGFVPPRHRGVLEARAFAQRRGLTEPDVLLLQADADTIYLDGYVDAMRVASLDAGAGFLVEAVTEPPPDFSRDHAGYVALSDEVDRMVAHLNVDEADDVVVDDKAAGFRLSDYFLWGGLRREFGLHGDEIYAETTRLFIRGKAHHAQKRHVVGAVAHPSRRKLFGNPALFFATAGFPREESWNDQWRSGYGGPTLIEAFEGSKDRAEIAKAVVVRQAHSVILFGLLPLLVADIAEIRAAEQPARRALHQLLALVPRTGLSLDEPGRLLTSVLALIDLHPEAIQRAIDSSCTV